MRKLLCERDQVLQLSIVGHLFCSLLIICPTGLWVMLWTHSNMFMSVLFESLLTIPHNAAKYGFRHCKTPGGFRCFVPNLPLAADCSIQLLMLSVHI